MQPMTVGRNLLCVAALGGVAFLWFAHAQNAATDAERFVGASRALEAEGWRVSRRWFEAGARTAWHRHTGAQILFVEKGRARAQERGGPLRELATGATFYTAPNVEHWHGATPDSEFTQRADAGRRGRDGLARAGQRRSVQRTLIQDRGLRARHTRPEPHATRTHSGSLGLLNSVVSLMLPWPRCG